MSDSKGLSSISQTASASPNLALDLPSSLSTHVLNALRADPRTVELRALAPHFYSLASRILDLFEEDELVDVLSDVRQP
jgi:GINS complex subunit 3